MELRQRCKLVTMEFIQEMASSVVRDSGAALPAVAAIRDDTIGPHSFLNDFSFKKERRLSRRLAADVARYPSRLAATYTRRLEAPTQLIRSSDIFRLPASPATGANPGQIPHHEVKK